MRVDPDDGAAAQALGAAVAAVVALDPLPAAVVVTGDLAEHGEPAEYELVRDLLAPLSMPVHVLPGNHDDRVAMRSVFDLPGSGGDPVRYAFRCGALRVIVCDTTVPGRDEGRLDSDALAWLDGELGIDGVTPTVVAMHQPPLVTGVPPMDAVCLPPEDRAGLGEVMERHPTVHRVIAGHVHRPMYSVLGGAGVFTAPSTYLQLGLDFRSPTGVKLTTEPPGFALHLWTGEALTTHVLPVAHGSVEPHRR